jgi:nucleotide-binding universal stress UspA family protein
MYIAAPALVAFKEILVPSDFSDISSKAVDYATSIARHFGAHLLLARVSEEIGPIVAPEGEWFETSQRRVEEQVEAAGIALREQGVSADAVNVTGEIKQAIAALIQKHDVDLVVLGTHGRRGFDRLIFGSEAESLARSINCPVLTIGPSVPPAPGGTWAPREIVCAVDWEPQRARTMEYAYGLAETMEARLTFLTVKDSKSLLHTNNLESVIEETEKRLPGVTKKATEIVKESQNGDVAANIVEIIQARKPDLLVMGASGLYWSLTHVYLGVLGQVLSAAPCPVLTIKSN